VSVRQALMVSLLFMPNNGCAAAKVSDNGTLGGKSLAINMMVDGLSDTHNGFPVYEACVFVYLCLGVTTVARSSKE